jgi:hypothetical protein
VPVDGGRGYLDDDDSGKATRSAPVGRHNMANTE